MLFYCPPYIQQNHCHFLASKTEEELNTMTPFFDPCVQIGPVVDHTTLSKDGHFVVASSNVTGRKTGDKAILVSPLHDSTVSKEGGFIFNDLNDDDDNGDS